jgi:hypothetical protein
MSRRSLVGALILLVALAACALNVDPTFVREIYLSGRLIVPAAIVVGVVGTLQNNRVVSVTTAIVAWLGIAWFIVVAIGTIIPDESIRLTDNPQGPSGLFLAVRFLLLITLGILIAVLFAKLQLSNRKPSTSLH